METVLNFGIQGLEILQKIHAQGIVYRDVKPENFCLSAKANSSGQYKVHIVDFGLAKHFMVKKEDPEPELEEKLQTGTFAGVKKAPRMQHIPLVDGRSLIGTPRYASVNSHMGLE